MKIFVIVFTLITMKLLCDGHHNNVKGREQVLLALICSFFCGMFFGKYLHLLRQKIYFLGEIETVLKNFNEFANDKCE